MSQSSFSLCAKCGNIKPAGVTDCEYCKSGHANSVSLEDLKRGLQNAQQTQTSAKPGEEVGLQEAAPPVVAQQVAAFSVAQDANAAAATSIDGLFEQTNQLPPLRPSGLPQPPEIKHLEPQSKSSTPNTSNEAKTVVGRESRAEHTNQENSPGPSQPGLQPGVDGFIGWLRRLFRF